MKTPPGVCMVMLISPLTVNSARMVLGFNAPG